MRKEGFTILKAAVDKCTCLPCFYLDAVASFVSAAAFHESTVVLQVLAAEGVHNLQAVGHLFIYTQLVLINAVPRKYTLESCIEDLLQSLDLVRLTCNSRHGLLEVQNSGVLPMTR